MAEMKSLGQLWSDSWNLYTKSFKPVYLFSLVSNIIVLLLMIFGFTILVFNVPLSEFKTLENGGVGLPVNWIAFIILGIALFALYTILGLALTYIVYNCSKNKKTRYSDSLKYALTKFWKSFLTFLLFTMLIIGLSILLIIPGIIFLIYWAFYLQVIVIKDLSGMDSLKYSKSVVKNRWWKTLGYGILFGVIPIVIMMILSSILNLVGTAGSIIYYFISPAIGAFMISAQLVYFLELDRTKSAAPVSKAKKSKK